MAKSFARTYTRKLREALEDYFDTDDESELTEKAIAEAGKPGLGDVKETFDGIVADELAKSGRIDREKAGRLVSRSRQRAEKQVDRDTYQAMEGFIHNLNTMHSRAGAQTPFSSINYGTDTSPEGRMVMWNTM